VRPFLRWIVHGKPKPPTVIEAEWAFVDPRTDALVAIAASMERFVGAAESVAAALERAERRALGVEKGELMGEEDRPARPEEQLSERASIAPDVEVPEEIEERLRREKDDEALELEEGAA
jgi:hypothetical protein